jgi:hypothetical protein
VTVSNCHLKEASMEQAITIGLDIAKHVFHAHGRQKRCGEPPRRGSNGF